MVSNCTQLTHNRTLINKNQQNLRGNRFKLLDRMALLQCL